MDKLRTQRWLPACLVAAGTLVACGGGGDEAFVAANGTAREHAQSGPPFGAGPTIVTQPASATVGAGAGVSFYVQATPGQLNFITGYRWLRNGVQVALGPSPSYVISAANAAAHAGSYTVEVLSLNGSALSAPATLAVVSGSWAPLGGRALASGIASQQPALAQCDAFHLAWVQANAAGIDELRVSRFIGTGWVPMGTALNANAGQHAAEPSIDCAGAVGAQRPVVAWSEGTGGVRAIQAKHWDGAAWVALGAVGSTVGADARRPVLRVLPPSGASPIGVNSVVAWVESGSARAKYWDGSSWRLFGGGYPGGNGHRGLTLALDGSLSAHTPLVTSFVSLPASRTGVSVQFHQGGGWNSLGQSVSPVLPLAPTTTLAGIGFSSDGGGLGNAATAVWAVGASGAYALESSQLASPDYDNEMRTPLIQNPAWTGFARAAPGNDLHALSFDSRAVQAVCPNAATRPTFAIAVNDSRGTRVLKAQCNRSLTDPLDWTALQAAIPGTAAALSLKMENDSSAIVASSAVVAGRHELSVWRFYP